MSPDHCLVDFSLPGPNPTGHQGNPTWSENPQFRFSFKIDVLPTPKRAICWICGAQDKEVPLPDGDHRLYSSDQ